MESEKSFGYKVGMVALIIGVLLFGAAAGAKMIDVIRKAEMTPAEYYQYAETKNRDAGEEILAGYYDAVRESLAGDSYTKNIQMKLELSDAAKSFMSLAGVDFSSVKNLEMDAVLAKEKKEYSNQLKLRGNDNDLLTINAFMDLQNEKAYYQIPELSESYLDISSALREEASEDKEDAREDTESFDTNGDETAKGRSDFKKLMALYDFDKLLIETKDFKSIYERYTDILIQSAGNVEKSEGGCEAEGVSQKADKYTVILNGKEIAAMGRQLLETLKADKTIKSILESIDKEAYQDFTASIEKNLDGMKGMSADELKAVMEVQIGKRDKIIGRKITLEGSGDSERIVFNILYPRDGDDFGFLMSLSLGDTEYIRLHGKGLEKSGVINGEFTLGVDESFNRTGKKLASADKLLLVTLKDYDLSKLAKGEISGTVTYSTEAVAELANYSLRVEEKGNTKESDGKLQILAGKDTLATIQVEMKSSNKAESVKPSDGDTIYDAENSNDMLAYQSEMDMVQFMMDIQKKLGVDLSSLFLAY